MKSVFAASPLSTQHLGVRVDTSLIQNRDDASEWRDISTRGMFS
jgi:hypothetical protein